MEVRNLSNREIEPDRAIADLFSHHGGRKQSRKSGTQAAIGQAQRLASLPRRPGNAQTLIPGSHCVRTGSPRPGLCVGLSASGFFFGSWFCANVFILVLRRLAETAGKRSEVADSEQVNAIFLITLEIEKEKFQSCSPIVQIQCCAKQCVTPSTVKSNILMLRNCETSLRACCHERHSQVYV